MEEDQIPHLKWLKDRLEMEFKFVIGEIKFVFSNSKLGPETRMPALIAETFQELFGDNPDDVRFNANSIRKFWEQRVSKMTLLPSQKEAHFAQTAHSEATASKHYKRKISNLIIFSFLIKILF